MKRINLLFILTLMFSVAHAADVVKACGHPDYPPFMWKENNYIVGATTDIVKIIFNELNIEVNSRFTGNWKRCLKSLENGSYDLVVSAYANDDRKVYADFTQDYISDDPTAVFVSKGKEFKFEKWEDLIGKKMGGIIGGSIGTKWDEFSKKELQVYNVPGRLQLFRMLQANRFDFTPTGLYTGLIQINKFGFEDKIVALKYPIKTGYLYVAMSKKSPYLKHLPYINKRLVELRNDGTVEKLLKKNVSYYSKKISRI